MTDVHHFILSSSISVSKPTVDDPPEVDIWIQFEGEQPTKVKLNYRNQPLVPGKRVPLDTSSSQPVVIRQILKPESVGPPIVSPVLQKPVRKCSNDSLSALFFFFFESFSKFRRKR